MRDVPARSWEISSGAWCAWREDDGLVLLVSRGIVH